MQGTQGTGAIAESRGATTPRRRYRAARLGLVAVLVVALVAGCSGDGSDGADGAPAAGGGDERTTTTAATSAPPTTVASPAPEEFTGSVEDFYRVPDPLPAGEPGDLIRIQPLGTEDGTVTVRVMYHSRDARDRDRAVTGLISYPEAAPPDGGWPVVSWAHGTTGLSAACAPSRLGGAAPGFGVEGVHVATDYVGLGPVGERHPYLSGASEGNSVIDAVRAAVRLEDTGAGHRWVAVGHSQGGHAALFAHELGQERAPELELLGTVAVAPAAVLDRTFGPGDQIVPRMVGLFALYGLAADHPELDPDDYVTPEIAAQAGLIDTACADQVIQAMVGVPTAYVNDPIVTEPAASILAGNDPGQVAVDSPLLVVGGSADTWVVPDRVDALFEQLCEVGQVTELAEIDGADHGSVVPDGQDVIGPWLEDRFAGAEPTDSCA